MNKRTRFTAAFWRGYRSAVDLQPTEGRTIGRDRILEAVSHSVDLAQEEVDDLIREAYGEVTGGAPQGPSIAADVAERRAYQ